jgi:hypothetical protein
VERAAPLLAAAVNVTEPLPEPEFPDATVIQETGDAAVQAHAA